MAPEKEEAVEKAAQPDQAGDPHRDSTQPDMDPGVIDVEEDAIDVDAVDEEDNEHKSSGDENENVVDLVSSASGPTAQADVDVIDLDEADVDGEEGEEGGIDEEGNRAQDFLRDDDEEDADREQANVKDEEKEGVTEKDAKPNDDETSELPEQKQPSHIANEKEPDERQPVQASENEQMHEPMDVAAADPGLKKDPGMTLEKEVNAGEKEESATVPLAKDLTGSDAGDLRIDDHDAAHQDHEQSHALPRDDSKNERAIEDELPTEDKINTEESVSQHGVQAKSSVSEAPQGGMDVQGNSLGAPEAIADVIDAPGEETPGPVVRENKDDSGEQVASQTVSDADAPGVEAEAGGVTVDRVKETEPEGTKNETPPAVTSMEEANAIESSHSKPEDAMDLEDAEEEEHEDAVEEDPEDMEDANANADVELSDEEPAHEMRVDREQESKPPANANQGETETVTKIATDHKAPDVPAGEDEAGEVMESEKQVGSVTTMEVDEKVEGGEDDSASRTPAKRDESLKPSSVVDGTNVQASDATQEEHSNAAKRSAHDTPDLADSNILMDEGKETSTLTSDKKKETETVSNEPADGPGGSQSANLTAPLFGMRPSGLPAQPVSFRTPPSFQRTSLSPNARPFIPAAHREAMRIAALRSAFGKDETASAAFPEATDKEDAKEAPAASVTEAKEKEEARLPFSPQQAAPLLQLKSDPAPPIEHVTSAPTSQFAEVQPGKQSAKEDSMTNAETPQPMSALEMTSPTNESQLMSARKAPSLKVKKDVIVKPSSKTQAKKVTFSLSNTKVVETTEPQGAPSHSESAGGAISESGQEGRLEDQNLKEEKSDDGFMYEVSHVPVSVRIGNGNVIKRGSLSTLRLSVAKSGEAKLDMFKEGASSLHLFESLSASRNILRVRKVSNRPIMTVTLMSNNNGGTQVAKKYYVHLGQHLYEKVFKACVAHLNSTSPDRRTGTESNASLHPVTKRLSTPVGSDGEDVQTPGSKRSADGARTADTKGFKVAERRRKLLETKAKLLENLKAVRKNKASGGSGETDRGPDKPAPGASNLSSTNTLASTSKPPVGQVVPKTPQPLTSKPGIQKPAIALGKAGPVKPLDQSSQKAKPPEAVVHTPSVLSEKRKQLADKHALSVRQKEVSEDRMQTDTPKEGGATSEGGHLLPARSSLKRKKAAAALSVQKHAPGKRAFDEAKPTDSKRQRIGSEKSASVASTSSITQEKLKALREQAKTGMGASLKSRAAHNVATTSKLKLSRSASEDSEEMKQIKSMLGILVKEKSDAVKQMAAIDQQRKKILEEIDRLKKALSTANSETAESKRETAKVTEERKAAEKTLADTLVALEKSRKDLKELQVQLSDMLLIVKAAQTAELSNEENEEKKMSLSRCDHDNVEDFFYRLRTFKPSTWPVEEADIGALACARHGWYNSGVNELKSSDGVTLVLGDLFENCESYMSQIEEMKTALVQKHALLSGWRGKQCARDIGKRLLSREALVNNASGLKEHAAAKRVRGFKETSKNVYELMAACGWKACETGVRCEWCGVEVGEEVHLKESHYQFCMLFREEMEVRRNAELLGLDWEVEGARLGWFFRSTYGDAMDEGTGGVVV